MYDYYQVTRDALFVELNHTRDEKVDTRDAFFRATRVEPGSNHITTVA